MISMRKVTSHLKWKGGAFTLKIFHRKRILSSDAEAGVVDVVVSVCDIILISSSAWA